MEDYKALIVNKIEDLTQKYPNQRFIQLLVNACPSIEKDYVYYISDKKLYEDLCTLEERLEKDER